MKKMMKILPVLLMICFVFTNVFAVSIPNQSQITYEEKALESVENLAGSIWKTVVTIVQILAVAAVVFAGLRYMFASADQKADIKKSMGILAVGAILVFAATTIIQFVVDIAKAAVVTE